MCRHHGYSLKAYGERARNESFRESTTMAQRRYYTSLDRVNRAGSIVGYGAAAVGITSYCGDHDLSPVRGLLGRCTLT